jgi:hypothetical protein
MHAEVFLALDHVTLVVNVSPLVATISPRHVEDWTGLLMFAMLVAV